MTKRENATNGPWKWLSYPSGAKLLAGRERAVIHCPDAPMSVNEADQALIASAPDLREEVQRLRADLATARQERDAALAERDYLQYANEKIVALNKGTIDSLRAKLAESDAAVRAARAETWEAAERDAGEADAILFGQRATAARERQ